MRSLFVQIMLALSLLLLFYGCSNDSSVEYVDVSHVYEPLPLNNRSFNVFAKPVVFEYLYDDSVGIMPYFTVDSVKLQQLDSMLIPQPKALELHCVPNDSLICHFEKNDFKSPYIKLTSFIHGNMDYIDYRSELMKSYGIPTGEKKTKVVKGVLTSYVDVGQDSVYEFSLYNVLLSRKLLHLVQNEKIPFTSAKKSVELNEFFPRKKDSSEVFLFLTSILQNEYFEDFVDSISHSYKSPESWKDSKLWTTIADSIMDEYGFGCKNRNLCKYVYGLDECSEEYYTDTVENELSKYNGTVVVCSKNIWRPYDNVRDSMGVCSSYNKGDSLMYSEDVYFICDGVRWQIADMRMINKILGPCIDGENRLERFWNNYYYCDGRGWQPASILDQVIGICGADVLPPKLVEYKDTVFYCLVESPWNSRKSSWHVANEVESYLFRHGGNCDLESDTLQFVPYGKSGYDVWGCAYDLEKTEYTWRRFQYPIPLETRYVEKGDNGNKYVYGYQRDYFFYMFSYVDTLSVDTSLPDTVDWSQLISVYSLYDQHLYPVFSSNEHVWLKSLLIKSVLLNGTWVLAHCPKFFRFPSLAEVEMFKQDVGLGLVLDIQYYSVGVEFMTTDFDENGDRLCVKIPENGGILNSTVVPCSKDKPLHITCISD